MTNSSLSLFPIHPPIPLKQYLIVVLFFVTSFSLLSPFFLPSLCSQHHHLSLSDLSLKGEVSCKYRGMSKLPQLEDYELSLMQKLKLSAGCFALRVIILVVSKSIFWHLLDTTSPDCTDRYCGTHRLISWHLWIFGDPFWVLFDTKICFLTPQNLYVILLPNGSLW